MSPFEAVALVVATVWMGVLTLVALLLVRQLGLVTVRLDRLSENGAPVEDGLDVGSVLPETLLSSAGLRGDDPRPHYLLIHSALCMACRELAQDLGRTHLPYPVIGLISGGTEDLADGMAELFPPDVSLVRDPIATEIVSQLRIETTPFAFEIAAGRITGKAAVRGAEHLSRFMETSDYTPAQEFPAVVEVSGRG